MNPKRCPFRKQGFVSFYCAAGLLLLALIMPCASAHAQEKHRGGAARQTCNVLKGLIIMVEFPDIAHKVDKARVERMFFTRLNSYIKEMSYDKFCIEGDVTRWYRMPHPVTHYSNSPRNLEVDRSRIMGLVNDALDAADKDVDFSRYAFQAIYMGATREEYGMVGLCGYPGMLGWAADTAEKLLRTKKGQVVNGGVAIFTNQAHLGTLFHDTAHVLGGCQERQKARPLPL